MSISRAVVHPNAIYAECNTGPVGATVVAEYDTFFDRTQADITAGITAALAAIGLTYAAGIFTATRDLVLALRWEIDINATPAGSGSIGVRVNLPDYPRGPQMLTPNPNTIDRWVDASTFAILNGETFDIFNIGTGAVDPVTYIALAIIRLL